MFRKVVIAAVLVAGSRSARADWYTDGKAIIEQVIEDELSTRVIPNAAARVPALCTYFPSSMRAIQEKRYTGLETVLRKEISDFIGYKVYLYIVDGAAEDFSALAQRRSGVSVQQFQESVKAVKATTAVGAVAQLPIKTSCVDPAGQAKFDDQTSSATDQMTICATHQDDPTQAQEVACAAGITVRDAFDGSNAVLADDVKRLADALEHLVPAASGELDKLIAALRARSVLTADAAIAFGAALGAACAQEAACRRLMQWATTSGAAQDVAQIIAAIQKRDYGSAARAVITSAVTLACQHAPSAAVCRADKRIILTFVTSLAVYVIDSVASGQTAESAEADFRASAVNLIEQYGSGLGYTRLWWSPKAILYPQLTLRQSWRPGHVNLDGSTMLSYGSIEFPTLRYPVKYTQYVYLAPQISLFDLLGPFSELATSGHMFDADPHRTKAFAAGFVVPRLDLEIAVPAVSRNLTVGVGVGFRLYRATQVTPQMARYCFVGDCAVTTDNLEVGVHVTYVP
ncbi:MAG TPA: hypothetical protein VF469_14940 [Kofleriaceae bacterium]